MTGRENIRITTNRIRGAANRSLEKPLSPVVTRRSRLVPTDIARRATARNRLTLLETLTISRRDVARTVREPTTSSGRVAESLALSREVSPGESGITVIVFGAGSFRGTRFRG